MAPIHLSVLVHGLWGEVAHVSELGRVLLERADQSNGVELKVLIAKTNQSSSTYDGIDWGGERVAKEVLDEVARLEAEGGNVVRFSIAGYSLGGLISRYVIGILHQQRFFDKVQPGQFNSFATPHVGLPQYDTLFSSIAHTVGPKMLSRTGEQFYAVDQWSKTGRPLLEVLADPQRIFYQALALFPAVTIYGNAVNDATVPYVTACIELEDPFVECHLNGLEVECYEDYPHLIKSFALPDVAPARPPKPVTLSPKWWKDLKGDKPLLPPFLQFKFPLNVILYMSLPLLIPTAISVAFMRLTLESRGSRARLRVLESEESSSERLINVLAQFEKGIEDAVAGIIDAEDRDSASEHSDVEAEGKGKQRKSKKTGSSALPILTPLQKKLIAMINTLPNLKKERAFIQRVRNSHGSIVCRDIKSFPEHTAGQGTVWHWADHFVV